MVSCQILQTLNKNDPEDVSVSMSRLIIPFPLSLYGEFKGIEGRGFSLYVEHIRFIIFPHLSLKKSQRKGQVISADFSSPKSMCEV